MYCMYVRTYAFTAELALSSCTTKSRAVYKRSTKHCCYSQHIKGPKLPRFAVFHGISRHLPGVAAILSITCPLHTTSSRSILSTASFSFDVMRAWTTETRSYDKRIQWRNSSCSRSHDHVVLRASLDVVLSHQADCTHTRVHASRQVLRAFQCMIESVGQLKIDLEPPCIVMKERGM